MRLKIKKISMARQRGDVYGDLSIVANDKPEGRGSEQ
jgi:hypothetical protein